MSAEAQMWSFITIRCLGEQTKGGGIRLDEPLIE